MTSGTAGTGEFRILALDGGGIKGVFVAALLAGFEESLGRPLVDHFDLIAGTSTGGIIAVGLGLGLTARDIVRFYEDKGPAIFAGHRVARLRQLFAAKYSREPLTTALEEVFGQRLLGESVTRLIVPSLNLETGQVHVFKTAHHERFVTDFKQRAVDVCLATAAAPTYFPTHRLASGTPLIDGGMWANNPMGAAAVEAVGVLEQQPSSVKLLGIGCTESPLETYDRRRRGLGINYWARRLVDTILAGQSSSSIGTAQLLLGHTNVHRISPIVSGGRYKLDSVGGIESLKGLGAAEARREFPKVRDMFLVAPTTTFIPVYGASS